MVFSFPRAVLTSVTFVEAMLIGARMEYEHHSIKMLNGSYRLQRPNLWRVQWQVRSFDQVFQQPYLLSSNTKYKELPSTYLSIRVSKEVGFFSRSTYPWQCGDDSNTYSTNRCTLRFPDSGNFVFCVKREQLGS